MSDGPHLDCLTPKGSPARLSSVSTYEVLASDGTKGLLPARLHRTHAASNAQHIIVLYEGADREVCEAQAGRVPLGGAGGAHHAAAQPGAGPRPQRRPTEAAGCQVMLLRAAPWRWSRACSMSVYGLPWKHVPVICATFDLFFVCSDDDDDEVWGRRRPLLSRYAGSLQPECTICVLVCLQRVFCVCPALDA